MKLPNILFRVYLRQLLGLTLGCLCLGQAGTATAQTFTPYATSASTMSGQLAVQWKFYQTQGAVGPTGSNPLVISISGPTSRSATFTSYPQSSSWPVQSWTFTGLPPGTYTVSSNAPRSGSTYWIYTMQLAAWDPNPAPAPNQAPTIAWTGSPGTVASGQSYTISAHGHDSDGNLTQVNVWKNGVPFAFAGGGNGTDGDSGNPTSDAGPATIRFTAQAVDSDGATSATISQTVTVGAPNNAPTAAISGSTALQVNQVGSWNFSASDADGNLSRWRFYASTNGNPQWSSASGSFVSGSYSTSFSTQGSYTWNVDVQDSTGASGTASLTVNVTAPPPVSGSITASPTSATAPGSTTISWSTSNATSVSVSGTGISSSATSGSRSVNGLAAGTHTYTLTAQGPNGPATQTATVTVNAPSTNQAPTAAINGSTALQVDEVGSWNFSASDADGNLSRWRFYASTNGNPQWSSASGAFVSGSYSTSFPTAGTYLWKVDVQDSDGVSGTASLTVNVTAPPPVSGSITANPTVIYSNQTATLNWTTTGTGFRWVHGYLPGMNGVNIYPAAVSGSTTVSSPPPGDYRFAIEYGPGSSATRMSFADLTVLGVNRTVALSVLPAGTGSATGAGTYAEGSSATLTATPDATHVFTGWSGDLSSTVNPLTFTVGAQNYNVVANFALRTFAVTATVSPVGAGSVTGAGNYTIGAMATLLAIPDATHVFTGWNGDLSGSANPVSFAVNNPANVTANFAAASFVLTTAAGSGGSVTAGGTYSAGTVITVTATPDVAHRFANWTGDASGTAATTAVTLDRAKFVQANFSAKAAQTIAFDPPGDHGLTSPPFSLTASATSGLPVSFSLLGGPAILTGSSVQVTGAGPVMLQANQPGDAFFLPAAPVNQTFNVIAAATLKYRGQSRTLLRDETTREAPPFVLEKP